MVGASSWSACWSWDGRPPVLRSLGVPGKYFAVVVGMLLPSSSEALTSSNSSWVSHHGRRPDADVVAAPKGRVPRTDPKPERHIDVVASGRLLHLRRGRQALLQVHQHQAEERVPPGPQAYAPALVSEEELFDNVLFLACSGAKGIEHPQVGQYADEPHGRQDPDGPEKKGPPQLGLYDGARRRSPGAVRPGDRQHRRERRRLRRRSARRAPSPATAPRSRPSGWATLADKMSERSGPPTRRSTRAFKDVPVLVVPYPDPVTEEELRLVTPHRRRAPVPRGFVTELNAVLASEAAQRGFYFADKVTIRVVRASPPADLRRRPRRRSG